MWLCGDQRNSRWSLRPQGATNAGLAAPRTLAIPFIWITAAVVGVRDADRPDSGRRILALAGAVGIGYAVALG
jgi:hypothetical protein